jgi:hypothetical protein
MKKQIKICTVKQLNLYLHRHLADVDKLYLFVRILRNLFK